MQCILGMQLLFFEPQIFPGFTVNTLFRMFALSSPFDITSFVQERVSSVASM